MPEHLEYPKGKPPRVRIVIDPKRPDLQQAVGKITGKDRKVANLRKSLGTYDPAEQKRLKPIIEAELLAILDAAEQMVRPPVVVTLPGPGLSRPDAYRVGMMARSMGQPVRRHLLSAVAYVSDVQIEVPANHPLAQNPQAESNVVPLDRAAAAKPADAHVVIPSDYVVDEWAKERKKDQKAKDQLASKLRRFFVWLETGNLPPPRAKATPANSDMNRVQADNLREFKRHLVNLMHAGTIADTTVNDWIDMLKSIFRFAKDECKANSNPAADLRKVPVDETDDRSAERFTPDEIRKIIDAALASNNPRIKWPYLLAATNGPRLAEIVEASTADVYQDQETGLWVFDIRLENRPSGQRIKTAVSKRRLPLVKLVRDVGFLKYVEAIKRDHYQGGDGPLFPQFELDRYGRLNTDANKVLMRWLRDEMQIKHSRKRFHGWRKTLTTLLEGAGVSTNRAEFITGHLPKNVHAKHYLDHPLPDLLAALESVPDPRTAHTLD